MGSLMPVDLAAGSTAGPIQATNDRVLAWLLAADHATALAAVWLGGALAGIAVAAWRHHRFTSALRVGRAGPAAVGLFHSRLVLPADFAVRFTPDERRLVRAHELMHIDRRDTQANAAAVLATWVAGSIRWRTSRPARCGSIRSWPAMRPCWSASRRAAALCPDPVNTHQAAAAPVLGCQWRSGPAHPLETRIRTLGWAAPGAARHDLGLAILLASWIAAFAAAWAAQPPLRLVEPPL